MPWRSDPVVHPLGAIRRSCREGAASWLAVVLLFGGALVGCSDATAPGNRDVRVSLFDFGGTMQDGAFNQDFGAVGGDGNGAVSDGGLGTGDGGSSSDALIGCGTGCKGCCKGSNCVAGTATTACGSGGSTCQACSTGQSCVAGLCVSGSKCDSSNCPNGCCDSSGTCRQGTSSLICGTGGARCQSCSGSAKCVNQKCSTTPTSYDVVLVSASTPGGCGILDGQCDVYVKVTTGGKTATSSVISNNNSPVWNTTLMTASASDLLLSFVVQVLDKDIVFDDTLCKGKIQLTQSILSSGGVTAICNSTVSQIVFKFVAK